MMSPMNSDVYLSNDLISMQIDMQNASFVVTDKRTEMQWRSGETFLNMHILDIVLNRPVYALCQKGQYWKIQLKTKSSDCICLGCEHFDSGISFDIQFSLLDDAVEIRIPIVTLREEKNWYYQLSRIEIFPEFAAVPQGTTGYLVLPNDGGVRILYKNSDEDTVIAPKSLEFQCMAQHFLCGDTDAHVTYSSKILSEQATVEDLANLPIYGMVVNDSAYAAIVIDGRHDAEVVLRARQGDDKRFSLNTSFTFRNSIYDDLDKVDRSFRYRFLHGAEANYSGIAKTYRNYLIKEKGIIPLSVRTKQNPAVDKLSRSFVSKLTLGFKKYPARNEPEHYTPLADGNGELMVFHTYDSAMKLCQKLYDIGVDSAWMNITGFNKEGHDGLYPTIFPIEEKFGGPKGFEHFINFADNLGYMTSVHVNYRDAYKISADFSERDIMQTPSGNFIKGGIWAGGQTHEVCPTTVMKGTIRRDLPQLKKFNLTGPLYLDNIFGVLQTCYAPEHRANRRQYCEATHGYVAYAKAIFGSIATEMINPEIVDLVDITIDLPFPRGQADYYLKTSPLKRLGLASEGVPLNQIVFHGLVCYCLSFSAFEMKPDYLLYAVEAGALPRYDFRDNSPESHLQTILDLYNVCCKQLGHLQKEFIESHEKLDNDFYLTIYSNGEKLLVNYSDKTYNWNGREVLAGAFLHVPKQA